MDEITIQSSRRRPRFHRVEDSPSFQLTERDVEIVRQVAHHRFLRSTHLSQLQNASHKKICERLTPLYHAGFLDRPRAQLEYHVRGGGSAHLVYALGNRGAQLLTARDGSGYSNVDWTHKNNETGREFIQHTLAISDVRVALIVACAAHQSVSFQHREQLFETLPAQTQSDRNPWAWRVGVRHREAFHQVGLIPDYVFALLLPDGRRRPFVIECDRGTMPVERSSLDQTSILRKFLAYETGRLQGLHTNRFNWKNFRVLTVTGGFERVNNMRSLITRTPVLKNSPLFLFADHATLLQTNILTHPWLDASGKPHSLI
jgi:hypothetical protein